MKQEITKEQRDQISKEKIHIFFKSLSISSQSIKSCGCGIAINIGSMIEFLGPDFKKFMNDRFYRFTDGEIYVFVTDKGEMIFCDALWIACVNKLGDN